MAMLVLVVVFLPFPCRMPATMVVAGAIVGAPSGNDDGLAADYRPGVAATSPQAGLDIGLIRAGGDRCLAGGGSEDEQSGGETE